MKQQIIFSDSAKGINIYRVWTGNEEFCIYTQRGWPALHLAMALLRKKYGEAYVTWVERVPKHQIRYYFK